MPPIQEFKEQVKTLLQGDPSTRGVGITWSHGHQCVLVNVAKGARTVVREKIKRILPEVEVVIQEVGDITLD